MINVMLAKNLQQDMDVSGMFASEKYDGVRSIFKDGKFYSRNGNVFFAPEWFVKKMPAGVVLDGELFTKRGDFQNIMSIVSKNIPVDKEWESICYVVFDLPIVNAPVEERFKMLNKVVKNSKYIKVVKQVKLKNRDHLEKMYNKVASQGGQGIMLRVPGSYYENKRSRTLLKYKKFKDDEAIVIGHEMGSGKYSQVLGKLVVKWKNNKNGPSFKVGSGLTEAQRMEYLKLFPVGTIVKVKFFEITPNGVPRFPVFLGVRHKKDL